jgi:hypothetical protein
MHTGLPEYRALECREKWIDKIRCLSVKALTVDRKYLVGKRSRAENIPTKRDDADGQDNHHPCDEKAGRGFREE